jgi:type II secretory pathway pseudopilin PulG
MQIVSGQKKQRLMSAAAAYTMVEILVATAVLGIMFVSLYAGFSSGFALIQVARENLRATQILQEKMETIRLYTWEQITTTNFVPTSFTEYFYSTGTNDTTSFSYTGTMKIESAGLTESYNDDLKKVTISVSWGSRKLAHTRQMKTFVTKHGLQYYVY